MTGTFINVAAILVGGTIGLLFGSRIPERYKNTVIAGMGLFTAALGLQMFLKSENSLIVLGALLIGALLGEWIGIEDGLQSLGQMLEKRFSRDMTPSIKLIGRASQVRVPSLYAALWFPLCSSALDPSRSSVPFRTA